MAEREESGKAENEAPVSLGQTLQSVAASFFGVQSERNRQRDFSRGNPWVFIAVGLGMTLLFVLTVVMAVKLALASR